MEELTAADFLQSAVWEYDLDAMARARPDITELDRGDGSYLVRARLTAADGTVFSGFCYLTPENDPGLIQPTLFTPKRQILFWYGVNRPSPAELDNAYRALGKDADQLFPIRFETTVETVIRGEIPAFLYMTDSGIAEIH